MRPRPQLGNLIYFLLQIKLPVLVGPLSAIQPFNHPLTFNFPWSLGYIRKSTFRVSPGETISLPFFFVAPRNFKLAQTPPSQGTNSHLDRVELRSPEKFTLGQCRIRTRDLSIFNRTRYQWTNAPGYTIVR